VTWHLLAPEFPPHCGGVGDYTALLEQALAAAGDRVHVWHPGVLPDRFGPRSRRTIETALKDDPGILLVQYVPSAFGQRGLNVPFCRWIADLARAGVDARVMFHEPFFYFGLDRPWRNLLAIGQRLMAQTLLRGASRVYYSTETWRRLLAPHGAPAGVDVLPIPATIPVDVAADAVDRARANRHASIVVGHFGTYGEHVAGELRRALPEVLRRVPDARVMLAGRGADAFAATLDASDRQRIDVLPTSAAAGIAAALRACDILVQPYPDGVTTRRTSVMGALSTGVAVITTDGPLTEAVWRDTEAVALVAAGDYAGIGERARVGHSAAADAAPMTNTSRCRPPSRDCGGREPVDPARG
jgi:glycosyltransferase involved in cell wall biosynthesis